ncbi:unnamed protein product [Choristocarpus tenellus]
MFLASQQWFDFSSAPHFDSIDDVSMDESVCPDVSHGRMDAFQKLDLSEGAKKLAGTVLSDPLMRKDINNCAAMYIGPSVNTSTCGPREDKSGEGTGHLVIHIRSGDVYSEDPHPGYGQPPLEYYIDILGARDWSRVSILAHADDDLFLGPVAKTPKMMVEAGAFPLENIVFHTVRAHVHSCRQEPRVHTSRTGIRSKHFCHLWVAFDDGIAFCFSLYRYTIYSLLLSLCIDNI